MTRIAYIERTFAPATEAVIDQANAIIAQYQAAGYTLTLRQLYYRFVAADLIPNTQQSYKRLGSIVNDGRLAGRIDWEAIEDRTRNLEALSHWTSPGGIIRSAARSYHRDLWDGQETRVEVWVEKDALVDVVGRAAEGWDVPYFACRGYVSQSEIWGAAQRLLGYLEAGAERVIIIHLGDHDPSGIDMTRDIQERLDLFMEGADVEVHRIALNRDQVERYEPPPNPAKITDSRYDAYRRRHGSNSWELDALEPAVLDALIQDEIQEWLDRERYDDERTRQETERQHLLRAADQWSTIVQTLTDDAP